MIGGAEDFAPGASESIPYSSWASGASALAPVSRRLGDVVIDLDERRARRDAEVVLDEAEDLLVRSLRAGGHEELRSATLRLSALVVVLLRAAAADEIRCRAVLSRLLSTASICLGELSMPGQYGDGSEQRESLLLAEAAASFRRLQRELSAAPI